MIDRHNMVSTVKTMLAIYTQSLHTQVDCFLLHVTSDF